MYISIVRFMVTYGAITWLQKVSMHMHHRSSSEIILACTTVHIAVKVVAHTAMQRLTRARIGEDETLYQKACSSRVELLLLLSLPNDEMVGKCSFEKNLLTKLTNKKEWK
ncbi:hypothetical protein Trydic_g14385 [Trypoxylus dichotomus]